MKYFKTKFLGLALAGLILGACSQTGTYETADLMNEQATAANKAGFKLTPFGTGNENARAYLATDCVNFCIDPADPEYSMKTETISNNSGPQTRVFTYTVYNTLTGFELAWNYAASNNASRKLRITVSGSGFASSQTYTSSVVQTIGNDSNTFNFNASWAACGVVTILAEILDENNAVVSGPTTTTYNLIGACGGCDDEFSAVTTCNEDGSMRTAIFTFTAGDDATYKIQGGLTAFSSDVVVNGATVIRVTNNNNNIISWTGTLDECDVKTITVTWNSTNSDDEITGDWTVEKDGVEILTLDELECNDSGEGYAPEVI